MDFFFRFICISGFLTLGFSSHAQYRTEYNFFGIQGGVNSFNIVTDNFNIKPQIGFTAGLGVRGGVLNSLDMVYGIDFYKQKFGVDTFKFRSPLSGLITEQKQLVDMSMLAVQVKLLGSLVLIHKHLSLELGPALQLNSKLSYDDVYENNVIDGYNSLQVKEIEEVYTLNLM